MEIASDLNIFEQYPIEYSQPQPNYPPPLFNYFNGGFKGGGRKKHKEKSWLDLLSPFECESDEEDYGDM